ncbi:hypothetical protein C818_03080 [Lachnospiraceae bacterium MD308]|jgi:hypothetical protein|nr:hypothetical protein C818_03080 [Lachnospiraceae bacterium MD308]
MKAIRKRNVSLAMVVVMSLTMLAGCGMKPDDAKAYVQATLDAGYKADFDEYAKITDSTKEDAQKLFDNNIDTVTNSLGFGALGATEETTEKYRELLKEIFAKAKYTVGDVKEKDGGFEVVVNAEPMQIFSGVQDELVTKLQEKVAKSGQPKEEEINQLAIDMLYDLLTEKLASVTYGEPQSVTVHVTKDSNNVWNITESDLQAVDAALFTIS